MRWGAFAATSFALFACESQTFVDSPAATPDASSPDAARDASPTSPTDAATDAGAGPCDGATFCDDFDEAPLGKRWDVVRESGGTLSFSPSTISPPNALLASFTPEESVEVFLGKDLGAARRIVCAFDLRVTTSPGDGRSFLDLVWIDAVAPGVDYYSIRFALHDDGAEKRASIREDVVFSDGGSELPVQSSLNFFELPAAGTWVRVTLDTNFKSASLTFGQREMLSARVMRGISGAKDVKVQMGVNGKWDPTSVEFDDVSCTVQK